MDKQREGFEKAYEPNPNKSPFTEVKFDEVARIYKPLDQFNPRIASSLNAAWYGWRIRQAEFDGLQAKVEELEGKLKQAYEDVDTFAEAHERECGFKAQLAKDKAELQKRVQFLEQELGAWKGKSIAAMINGMCKQCGKEPWQAIFSDKEGYALLHCFGCGANKYEWIGEQALKGEGQ
ncbi:hypothetical protein ACK13T_01595 [Acinetobacter baumannii]|uniref:hypothetical protein n=1 Tax=Acinetobacter baumannii TaxID=470 RepID=UPI0039098AD8